MKINNLLTALLLITVLFLSQIGCNKNNDSDDDTGNGGLGVEAPSTWVSVLIAENAPPAIHDDQVTYVEKIVKLAPNLEQIHLRSKNQTALSNQQFANLISLLRDKYGSTLEIGFHPDNSKTSCELWGCGSDDCTSTASWQCVLNESIILMNTINDIVQKSGNTGFTIFSIEQSYIEDVANSLAEIKHCLSGSASALPNVTPASPAVKFGNVLPSYGSSEIYGSDGYDYGYPQYYNLGKHLTDDACVLLQKQGSDSPYFPDYSAANCLQSPCPATSGHIFVIDVDTEGAYSDPKIPCLNNTNIQNAYNTLSGGTAGANPTLASACLAYLMTQYPPITGTVALNGAEVFITLSGEPSFLGGSGWTLDSINNFHNQLNTNFSTLKTLVPSLFPSGGTDPSALKYAIWNYDDILNNITLP